MRAATIQSTTTVASSAGVNQIQPNFAADEERQPERDGQKEASQPLVEVLLQEEGALAAERAALDALRSDGAVEGDGEGPPAPLAREISGLDSREIRGRHAVAGSTGARAPFPSGRKTRRDGQVGGEELADQHEHERDVKETGRRLVRPHVRGLPDEPRQRERPHDAPRHAEEEEESVALERQQGAEAVAGVKRDRRAEKQRCARRRERRRGWPRAPGAGTAATATPGTSGRGS